MGDTILFTGTILCIISLVLCTFMAIINYKKGNYEVFTGFTLLCGISLFMIGMYILTYLYSVNGM